MCLLLSSGGVKLRSYIYIFNLCSSLWRLLRFHVWDFVEVSCLGFLEIVRSFLNAVFFMVC